MEYYKYWGATYRKHQKMRPSKRRKLNVKGDYDCSINNEDKNEHTLSYHIAMIHMLQNNTFNTFSPSEALWASAATFVGH